MVVAIGVVRNPAGDDSDVEAALRRLGFTTTKLVNDDARAMNEALKRFAQAAAAVEIVFVFYSGHGASSTLDAFIKRCADTFVCRYCSRSA
jgi:uncharacterized caspase-like protein